MNPVTAKPPRWPSAVLVLAGVYNLAWGTLANLYPQRMYEWSGLAAPPGRPLVNVELWQCVGMLVGFFGLGYALAARNPYRHWLFVLVGLASKVAATVGVVGGVLTGRLAAAAITANVFNDLIWWVPFALILYRTYRASLDAANRPPPGGFGKALEEAKSPDGKSLATLSAVAPVLVVFLRHFG